jgi:osmotically inducible protein OsmC
MPTRKSSATWEGGLKGGKGSFKAESGLSGAYSFASRFETAKQSNPEELLAAALASCYSMALSGGLEKNGTPPTRVETSVACTIDKVGDGFKITKMHLVVRGKVPNVDAATFDKHAQAAKEGCPVSQVFKGNVQMTMEAKLE